MKNRIHTFTIDIDWELFSLVNKIERFDTAWQTNDKTDNRTLDELKSVATVRSAGASTRIEGSLMSDEEVEVLLNNIDITKISDRDSQEVLGYYEALDLINNSYENIEISEGIRNLHNILLKYSSKDEWHKGNYKLHGNAVEAEYPDGTKQIISRTTEPGFPTQDAMKNLIEWYRTDNNSHPLVKTAVFSYDFVSIHPFQDGNGRLSRLLTNLLLLKNGYRWISYISLEHEIEARKTDYYRILRECQSQRPGENIAPWIEFFFEILNSMTKKLEEYGQGAALSKRERSVLTFIKIHSGCRSGEIAQKLAIPNPTIKRMLSGMVKDGIIERHGNGRSTAYSAK